MDPSMIFVVVVVSMAIIVVTVFFVSLRKEKKKEEERQNTVHKKSMPNTKKPDGNINETVYLVEKIDERKRSVDGTGSVTITNELYQLVFKTRQGSHIKLSVSKQVLKELPFNEKGIVTYKGKNFIKFKYAGGVIEN